MEPNEIEVSPGVFTSANGVSLDDKDQFTITHNGVKITMSREEFRDVVECGQYALDGNVEEMTAEALASL